MNAAHFHLIINHAPLFGLIAAVVLLGWGVLRKSYEVRMAAFAAFVLSGVAGAIAFLSGDVAEGMVENLPGISEAAIERHQDAATVALVLIVLSGMLGIVAYFSERRTTAFRRVAQTALLTVAVFAIGAVGYAANLGGQIHHSEITAGRLR